MLMEWLIIQEAYLDLQMIKNKKAVSSLVIALIATVVGFLVFILVFPKAIGNVSDQIESKASIAKYLPTKILSGNKDKIITDQAKLYSFDIVLRLLSEHSVSGQSSRPLSQGKFLLVRRDILDENHLINFIKIDNKMYLYVTGDSGEIYKPNDLSYLQSGAQAYSEMDLFKEEKEQKDIQEALGNKKFVVMPVDKTSHDEEIFLHLVTGLPFEDEDLDKEKNSPYYALETILERNVVDALAFSTDKKPDLYFNNVKGDEISRKVNAGKNDEYILIYRLDDYVVFFPIARVGGVELTNEVPIKIEGSTFSNTELSSDLLRENFVLTID